MTEKSDLKRTIAQKSIETKTLEDYLRTIDVGKVVSYDDLNRLIGSSCRPGEKHYYALRTAIKTLQHESILFESIRLVGIRHMEDGEVPEIVHSEVLKSRAASKRAMTKSLGVKNYHKLDQDKRVQLDTQRSIAAMNLEITKAANVKKISGMVNKVEKTLSLQQTLDSLK